MLKILLSKILYKFLLCIKIVSEIFPREQSIEQNIIRSIVVNGSLVYKSQISRYFGPKSSKAVPHVLVM